MHIHMHDIQQYKNGKQEELVEERPLNSLILINENEMIKSSPLPDSWMITDGLSQESGPLFIPMTMDDNDNYYLFRDNKLPPFM